MNRLLALVALVVLTTTAAPARCQDVPGTTDSPPPNPVVLRVDGTRVRAAEISMVMLNLRAQLQATGGSATTEELLEVATQRIVEQKLMAQEARRFGMTPDEQQVARLLGAAEEQAGGGAALERTLAGAGSSRDELLAMLEDMDLARQLIAKRIAPTVEVGDDDVRRFYADNADGFAVGERIRPRHIVFAVSEDAGPEEVERARARAEAARRRVEDGEPFADVAREVSEGPSAARGGDLGLVPPEALEPPFAAAALPLEPGEVSEVVRTTFGFHVITVDERTPAGTRPLSEVREAVERQLRQQRTAEAVVQLLQSLSERAEIEILDADIMAGDAASGG